MTNMSIMTMRLVTLHVTPDDSECQLIECMNILAVKHDAVFRTYRAKNNLKIYASSSSAFNDMFVCSTLLKAEQLAHVIEFIHINKLVVKELCIHINEHTDKQLLSRYDYVAAQFGCCKITMLSHESNDQVVEVL